MAELPILRDLGWLLGGAAILLLVGRPFRVPPILTYMVAGLVLGPIAGLLTVSESVHLFSELGVALLLFVVGLELSFQKIRDVGRVAAVVGVVQVGLLFGLGFGMARAFGFAAVPAAFLGLTAAFSSTVVVIKLLGRLDIEALHGRLAIGILLVQDVLVAVALTLVGGLGTGTAAAGGASPWGALAFAFLGITILGIVGAAVVRWILPALFDWLAESTEALFVASLTWAFAFILAAEALHLSVELGAFLAGILLAQMPQNEELQRRVHPLVDFFLVVFFVALGAQLDPATMFVQWPTAVALTVLILVVKPAVTALLLHRFGQPPEASIRAGITIGQVSEFAFILVGLGIAGGLVEPAFLGTVGLLGLVTIGVSAVVVPRSGDIAAAVLRRPPPMPPEERLGGHVVVAGMNTLGRILVHRLAGAGETVVAVDTDPAKLDWLPATTLVGSIEDVRVIREAGVARAKLMVSALQIEDVNSLLAYRCHRMGVPASIHAFETSLVHELLEIGADHVMISKYDGIGQMEDALRDLGAFG